MKCLTFTDFQTGHQKSLKVSQIQKVEVELIFEKKYSWPLSSKLYHWDYAKKKEMQVQKVLTPIVTDIKGFATD